MKKDLTEMVFILDRSGSMGGLEEDTIKGFNDFISRQKELKGEAILSTILFDHDFEVLHNRVDLHFVKRMTHKDYYTRGTTALLDSIGRSIQKIISVHKSLREDKPEKTVFVITTDGMENASTEFSARQIRSLIQKQTEMYGWEFIFLGANIDALEVARDYGFKASRAANFHSDKEGTALNYKVIHEAVQELRVNSMINDDWKDEIDTDFETRR